MSDQNIAPAIHECKGHLIDWRGTGTAPFNTPVEIKAGSMTFLARLLHETSMDEDMRPCDQWVAKNHGEHPPCWTDGACWSSNENDDRSLQPEAWRHIGAASAAPELLEALKDAYEVIDEQLCGEFPELITAMRAAITKAEG